MILYGNMRELVGTEARLWQTVNTFYFRTRVNQTRTRHCAISEAGVHQRSYISTCDKRGPCRTAAGGNITKSSKPSTRSKGCFIDTT